MGKNLLKIDFPKLEALIDSLNFILKNENSDFYIEYNIGSNWIKHNESLEEVVWIELDIDMKQYSSSIEDNWMIYRDFSEISKKRFTLNYAEEIAALDYRWFYMLLRGTLFIVDNNDCPQLSWPRHRPIKTVSWNTMINTKRDGYNDTNKQD